MLVINTRSFGRFWPVSWTITHHFGVRKRCPWLSSPGVCLRVPHHHSQFWQILTRFVDYYSPFWGPKAFSIVVEPQGVLMCWSSTLGVLADSGPFHGLLHTIFWSKAISMVVELQGALTCRSSTIIVWADSGPFLGLLLTILGS